MRPPRQLKAAVVIVAAAAGVVVSGVVFVDMGLGSHPVSSVAEVSPIPTLIQKTSVGCLSPAIVLTGAISGCLGVLEGMSCPKGPFNTPRVVHLRGSTGDYILYLEVDGGYQGPGTYQLTPWKKDTLNGGDQVAKVAVREWDSGRLWESYMGSLTIDSSEESGRVEADLRIPDKSSSPILNIDGPWTCP